MSDQWYYTHAEAVHGPVSGGELRRLVRAGGLLPIDLVWPVGWEPLNGVPAEAALRFPEPLPLNPVNGAPPPIPEWLPELAAALASGEDLASLPSPPPEVWLPDIRRTEDGPRLRDCHNPGRAAP